MAAQKAIIIGAGIGGLSAGIALQKAGYTVAIYERAAQILPVGAGISLWANAIKALDKLGVGDKIRERGMRDIQGGFHAPDGRTLIGSNAAEAERRFGTPTVIIHRADLSQILTDGYGGAIHTGKVFTGYDEAGEQVIAHFADGTQNSADVLICADGIHSVLRQSWFPGSKPRYAGYMAWRGVVKFDHAQVGGHYGETLGRGARFGIAPLMNGEIYWFCTENLPEGTRFKPEERHPHLLEKFGSWYAPIPALIQNTPAEAILHNDIYDIAPLNAWVRGRAALLGDSAHAMTPNMGQGGCQAIEDAVVLGKCLQTASSVQAGLLEYQRQRLAHANQVLINSRRIGQVFQIANPVVVALRNFVMRITPPSAQLRTMAPIVGHEV